MWVAWGEQDLCAFETRNCVWSDWSPSNCSSFILQGIQPVKRQSESYLQESCGNTVTWKIAAVGRLRGVERVWKTPLWAYIVTALWGGCSVTWDRRSCPVYSNTLDQTHYIGQDRGLWKMTYVRLYMDIWTKEPWDQEERDSAACWKGYSSMFMTKDLKKTRLLQCVFSKCFVPFTLYC